MKKNIFGVIGIVTLLSLFFACEAKESGGTESASQNILNGTESSSENISNDSARIQNGGLITIMEAREIVSNNEFIQPDDGMKFIGFDILIDNERGTSDISLNLFLGSFQIRDSEGFTYTPSIWDVAEPKIDVNGTVEKGDILRGWITVEVKNTTQLNDLRLRLNTAGTQSDWINVQ